MSTEQEELIYGKNAVLAYLEQTEDGVSSDFQKLQQALAREAQRNQQDGLRADALEKELRHRVNELSKQTGLKLALPNIKQLEHLPSVKVNKILLATGGEHDGRVDKIKALARKQKIPIQSCDRRKLDQIAGPQRRHQGVVALISPAEMWQLETFLQKMMLDRIAREMSGQSMDGYMVAVLDGIEDPHNLGAIIRVAEASGVKAILIPQRRAAGLTGTVAKISAGAVATLPVVRVSNLVQALETLKKYGFWVAALDLDAPSFYTDVDLKRPLVIVIGSEGKGVGRLVKEHCDLLVKIPMLGKTESLNASVAAGIFFYEVVRQCEQR
ncbi:MAG TPA: 23S rRNA (guanosine(2251)-2'-O)-methyltransferase RlmB [Candidatus Obscuribacterales bacterium]